MASRHLAVSALVGAIVATLSPMAHAITIARVTRHGYILTDDPGSTTYGDQIPVASTAGLTGFIQDATTALENLQGFHEGKYLAAMQVPQIDNPLAFYLSVRNDVRGIGIRSPVDGRSELYDLNGSFGSQFGLDGFVFLNSLNYYTDPSQVDFGRYLICTQEFGHRFASYTLTPAFPAGTPMTSAPPLQPEDLLGRGNTTMSGMVVNRAHWSFFLNTGGSPMEGNAWSEVTPGVFQTGRPSFQFSPLDMYLMGLAPASSVTPSYLIAEPTSVPRGITRDSQPDFRGRGYTVHGRRVDVTIDDILHANGVRSPAYPDAPRDMDVVWVLLAAPDAVDDALVTQFDDAIESCGMGYSSATQNIGHLVDTVPHPDDAGTPDAGASDAGNVPDASATDAPTADVDTDASETTTDATPHPMGTLVTSGCGCRVPSEGTRGGSAWALAGLALTVARRRRRPA